MQLADLGSDQDDVRLGVERREQAGDTQFVQAELSTGWFQIARHESMDGAYARPGPHRVDEHRPGAVLEVPERVQAGRAGVDRLDVWGKAQEDVVPEAVVAVPGVAEADHARAAHRNVKAPRGAPFVSAR